MVPAAVAGTSTVITAVIKLTVQVFPPLITPHLPAASVVRVKTHDAHGLATVPAGLAIAFPN